MHLAAFTTASHCHGLGPLLSPLQLTLHPSVIAMNSPACHWLCIVLGLRSKILTLASEPRWDLAEPRGSCLFRSHATIQCSWPGSSSSKVPPSGYCTGSCMAMITLSKAFPDSRIDRTLQVPLRWERPCNIPKSTLRGAVLPILQMEKPRLRQLSWRPEPSLSRWSLCSPLGVHTPQALLSAVCCLRAVWAGRAASWGEEVCDGL